jgi:hypothetical protein
MRRPCPRTCRVRQAWTLLLQAAASASASDAHPACAGDLDRLQAQAAAVRPVDPAARLAAAASASWAADTRAHLESNVAAALALESPKEYRRWLLTYVRHLAGAHDHAAPPDKRTPVWLPGAVHGAHA